MSTTYNIESNDYEPKISTNGMDSTISSLKTRLFDLEQQEKDYNALNQKLAQLKKEFAILNNTKNKLSNKKALFFYLILFKSCIFVAKYNPLLNGKDYEKEFFVLHDSTALRSGTGSMGSDTYAFHRVRTVHHDNGQPNGL